MYRNQNSPNKRWLDPSRKAELAERDRIRQAHYAKLERAKQGLPEPDATAVIEESPSDLVSDAESQPPVEVVEESVQEQPQEPEGSIVKAEPKYYTQLAKKGWYNVIGPAGVPVNATLLRLEAAEKKATRMNNGANR